MQATKWKAWARIAVIAALSAWNTSIVFAATPAHKVLLVVAHPDDEYVFAPTTYRIARELGGTVDEVVITNGEGGYRYSLLAEKIYGFQLTREDVGRAHLPAIRKQEAQQAGRILGIHRHYLLNQKDHGYTLHRGYPLTRTATDSPAFIFDRRASFGFHGSLNYTIVVNWVIAEHKSQGLFQTDSGKHDEERFWLFAVSGA